MTEIIFTIDYELYGSGEGTLRELVLEPAARLADVFRRHGAKCVVFVEALELARIKEASTDPEIGAVCDQIDSLHQDGHEIGLHIHPQWANARYRDGSWRLDLDEYNLSTLSRERIESIVDEALGFLCHEIKDPSFRPIAFRAGNWLIQPTKHIVPILADRGIRVDSSLFKGGFHRKLAIDFRAATSNESYYWSFSADVNKHDPEGMLIEVPIYTTLVPMWRMITKKRLALHRRSVAARARFDDRLGNWLDYARMHYPLKFDFCRMTLREMVSMVQFEANQKHHRDGARPMVAIGHTKDLTDVAVVDEFLCWLREHDIRVTTFRSAYKRYLQESALRATPRESKLACELT